MKRFLMVVLAFFILQMPAQAQFLKKLKKKVQETVENTVTDNVADKAASETEKSMNSIWESNMDDMGNLSISQASYEEIPDNYHFDWVYTMTMESKDGETEIEYLFGNDKSYLGTKIRQKEADMILVFDPTLNLSTMYMNSETNRMVMASNIKIDEAIEKEEMQNVSIIDIAPKTILGYVCKGYQMENEDYVTKIYITEEVALSFGDLYNNRSNPKIPKSIDPEWFKKASEGLMMEMDYTDKKKDKNNFRMYCTNLLEKDHDIKKADYKSL